MELKDECCKFWDIAAEKDYYSLMQPNMHDLMSINKDKTHMANTIAKYFEVLRAKKITLFLMKPPKMKTELYPEELHSLKIKGVRRTTRFDGGDKRELHVIIDERNRFNLKQFFNKYPDLEEVQIKDMV